MNEIGIIFKHNLNRVLSKKGYVFLTIMLTSVSIALAIFFTSKFEMKGNIAYVTNGKHVEIQAEGFQVTKVKEAPSMSEFVMKKYDAAIAMKENGQLDIKTIKGKAFKEEIENAIGKKRNQSVHTKETRKIGTNILGYVCMFVLLGSVMFMHFYKEDREKKILIRIVSSKIRINNYLLGHILFVFCMLYIPIFLILMIEKSIFNVKIGFSYLEYSYMLAILVLLGISFSLFMSTIIKKEDNVVMLSSSIIVLTSIVAGLFFPVKDNGTIIDWFVRMLPQKQYLLFIESIENGHRIIDNIGHFIYVVIIMMLFFAMSVWMHNKMVKTGKI